MSHSTPTTKRSTVRHTRAVQRDRAKRPTSAPPAATINAHLTDIVHPATYNQIAYFHALGLRERTLTLPVMMAFVLSLIWRQIGSVTEAVRCLEREGLLWTAPLPVSQQAVEQRLRSLPAELFRRVLHDVLPRLHERAAARRLPTPPALAHAQMHFGAVVAFDGSTLDSLLRKVGLLRGTNGTLLGGRMAALLDVVSRLPHQIWYEPDSAAHDQAFWPRIRAALQAGWLVLFDLGFVNYALFDALTTDGIYFLTRLKQNAVVTVLSEERRTSTLREARIRLGRGTAACSHELRLIEVRVGERWQRYVTNVLDQAQLPGGYVAGLYAERWRIEDAYNLVKRVLGLAYFWGGASNTVQMQVWASWILYSVLLDLTGAVATELRLPLGALSAEMVFRGLYHYTQAHQRDPTLEVVGYLAAEAKGLGLIKRKRRKRHPPDET
jgi:DDE family transposase